MSAPFSLLKVGKSSNGYDMTVRRAWRMGYSGRGVTVGIIDDGVQVSHPDLRQNYDPQVSTDVIDHDHDPTPVNPQLKYVGGGLKSV